MATCLVAVIAVAFIVAVLMWLILFVAVLDCRVAVSVCGRHCRDLWPSLLMPSFFVAVVTVAVVDYRVAVIICGRHCLTPLSS